MRASTLLCSLFVAGALSSPFKRDYTFTDEVVVMVTVTTVMGGPEPTTAPTTTAVPTTTHRHRHTYQKVTTTSVAPLEPTSVPPQPSSTSTPPPPPPPSSTSTPPPPPPPSTTSTPPLSTAKPTPVATKQASSTPDSDGSPLSGGVSLLTTANQFRSLYGLASLKWDSQLEQNALKTGTDGGGVNQNHELNPGSMAQVITPGMATDVVGSDGKAFDLGGDTPFQLSYAAWLCEDSGDPQLKSGGKDQCQIVARVLNMQYSDTGHHDILCSSSYSAIGCAFAQNPNAKSDSPYQGLWVCDLH